MMTEKKVIADIALCLDHPTNLTFDQLFTWVVWQFPRKKGGGLCGAVRPPVANHGWYPAIINTREKRVQVHGHLPKPFATPEAAAENLDSLDFDE
jgi:hypothetical protein